MKGVEEKMKDTVVEIKKEDGFREMLDSKLPVVVDYWALWCGPCIAMKPIYHKLAIKHSEIAKFASVDIDKHPVLSKDILSIPTFKVYSNGKLVGTIVGGYAFEKFEAKVLRILKKITATTEETRGSRPTTLTPRRRSHRNAGLQSRGRWSKHVRSSGSMGENEPAESQRNQGKPD